MTNEEDISLRDLVSQTLTASGVLPKIKAELRANVFLALESNPDVRESLILNKELSAFSKTEKGSIVLNLIRDFLQFFNLEFTLAVFDPETSCGTSYQALNREELLKKCKVPDRKVPVICDVLNFDGIYHNLDLSNNKPVDSPAGLNSTYIKAEPSLDSTPVRLGGEDNVPSLTASEKSLPDSKTPEKQSSSVDSEETSESTATPPRDKLDDSLNLLVFTPVQHVKAVPKQPPAKIESPEDDITKKPRPKPEGKSDNIVIEKKANGQSIEDSGKKSVGKMSASSLGDLPPLPGLGKSGSSSLKDLPALGVTNKENSVKDIRGLIEGLKDIAEEHSMSSKNSKRDEIEKPDSPDSQRTTTSEDVEEEISELLNSHASTEEALTADESISRLTNHSGIDYIESI